MQKHYYIVIDLGGTNLRLALVEKTIEPSSLSILKRKDQYTQDCADLCLTLNQFLQECHPFLSSSFPDVCVIAVAGVIKNQICHMTNAHLLLDAKQLTQKLGFPVVLINDFLAMSWGISALEEVRNIELSIIRGTKAFDPHKIDKKCLILGAGTGLGVGFVHMQAHNVYVLPSEGGHIFFSAFDDESWNFIQFIHNRSNILIDAEDCVSGKGLNNLLEFYYFSYSDPILNEIYHSPRSDWPQLIIQKHHDYHLCQKILNCFLTAYIRHIYNMAITFLPKEGVFLSGGITAYLADHLRAHPEWEKSIDLSSNEHIKELLRELPVYFVANTDFPLLGCARYAYIEYRKLS